MCDICNSYFSFLAIFCRFTPLTTQKIKVFKKWGDRLQMSSFYTCVPKIMITWCMVPEIWCATDGQTDRRTEKVTHGCYQTILTFSWSSSQTIQHTFLDMKQYWRFQRVPSKLNYSKNFFQSTCHTIMTLSESYYQTILTYSELISNSIHTFTELLPDNCTKNTFLRVWMDTWTDKKFSNGKFSTKNEKL